MTEGALRLPQAAEPSPNLRALPSVRAVTRPAAVTRRPLHVAVAVGVTAGLYAVSLAGVTALQAGTDARLAADRAPAAAAIAALRETHDATEADLTRIEAAYASAAAAYQAAVDAIGGHETALIDLGKRVAAVEGSAAALKVPTIPRLPSVSTTRTVYVSRPSTHACTTASGKPC